MGSERIKGCGIGDFPAVERGPLIFVGVNDDALFAIVHAQSERAAAAIGELHAEKAGAIDRPVFQIAGADTDITERIEIHGLALVLAPARQPRRQRRIIRDNRPHSPAPAPALNLAAGAVAIVTRRLHRTIVVKGDTRSTTLLGS